MIASARRKWFALALLLGVQFMVVLDIAIVNVALPSIQTDLGFSQEDLQWVVSAYALLFGGFLLLGGRVADLLGRRRIFVAGLIVFTGASLLSGFAWSDTALIAARALQGLGAALITHWRFSGENPRSVWIEGSATFTIAMSSTTMNCTVHSSASASHLRDGEDVTSS